MCVAKSFKFRVKHKNAVFGITDMAGLLISAAALFAIAAHEIQNARINQRLSRLAKMIGIRPRTEAVETLRAQEVCRARHPI